MPRRDIRRSARNAGGGAVRRAAESGYLQDKEDEEST